MIFLNEDIVSSGFTSVSSELRKLNEELGLNEADFAQFANPNAGYEICYEMEMAFNALERQMLNEEAAILLSEAEEEGEKESKGFWKTIGDTLVRWGKEFLKILGKAWNAIKNFFTRIWEYLFGKKAKEQVEETKKELKLNINNSEVKYSFVKIDSAAIKEIWDMAKKIESEAGKSISDGNVVVTGRSMHEYAVAAKKEINKKLDEFKSYSKKNKVVGSAADAQKNLEESLRADGFITDMISMGDKFMAASKKYDAEVVKIGGEVKRAKNKEEARELKDKAGVYKTLTVLMKDLGTLCTSVVSTFSPVLKGAQNPKKVRA